jgi:hypothetical protein
LGRIGICVYMYIRGPFMLTYVYAIIFVYYDILTPYCFSLIFT